jgi:hypothetical protein
VVTAGAALELQGCNDGPSQRFALDGDAILLGTQGAGRVARDAVVEAERGRGADRTPLVVGPRDADDAEYFRFRPTSLRALWPTRGFVPVQTLAQLDAALAQSHWGTVIELDSAARIEIPDTTTRHLGEGVTLRGYRRGLEDGPEIFRSNTSAG